eukprot:TRINITY_DN7620_c0_g1_i3.p1 TRINITY_DN7620_c0_g1~~TRINITY_DN7620_c0_g1_i3.p1  ORF type:complete len:213 (-),score=22.10 TRINITY_DN7620_c0_g1_i3:1153-1791(-)
MRRHGPIPMDFFKVTHNCGFFSMNSILLWFWLFFVPSLSEPMVINFSTPDVTLFCPTVGLVASPDSNYGVCYDENSPQDRLFFDTHPFATCSPSGCSFAQLVNISDYHSFKFRFSARNNTEWCVSSFSAVDLFITFNIFKWCGSDIQFSNSRLEVSFSGNQFPKLDVEQNVSVVFIGSTHGTDDDAQVFFSGTFSQNKFGKCLGFFLTHMKI